MDQNGEKVTSNRIKIGLSVAFLATFFGIIIFFAPIIALFIFLTLIFAAVLVIILIKVFRLDFDKKDDKKVETCIDDVSFLDGKSHIVNLPLPFALIDEKKNIISFNSKLKSVFGDQLSGENLEKLLGAFDVHVNKQFVKIGENQYDIYCSKISEENDKNFYTVCFVDVSDKESIKLRMETQRTVAGLIFIDNFDEVMEDIDDFQVPIFNAMIEKKLGDYVSDLGGILKKFEKDRYIFVISVEYLEKAKEKKFDILNEIKELNAGRHIPVTLSIGIGIGYGNLEGSMKNAKDAMELALGRGGDQAVIKDGEKYLFFGGKSGETSHNARIRARVKADALESLISDADIVYVMGHKIPDFDALGSAIGIYRIAKDLGKTSYIVLDTPSKGIENLYNEIKKKSEYEDMFILSEKAIPMATEKTMLVVVDTHVPSLVESREVLDKIKKVVLFDHHRKGTDYIEKAVLAYNEPYASSTSELVTEVIRHFGDKVDLKPIEADALLAGITLDTKGFGVKAGAITFECAAYLRRNGADTTRVKRLFRHDFDAIKIRSITIGNANEYRGGIVISRCPYEGDGANVISAQAADELLNIVGVRAALVLCKMNGKVFISGRSFGDVNVQVLLEKIGGGGHQTMAGAQFENVSVDEAEQKIKIAIDEYLKEEI